VPAINKAISVCLNHISQQGQNVQLHCVNL